MNQQEALQILINVAEASCKSGVLTLKDAKQVATAVEVFTAPPIQEEKVTEQSEVKGE